MKSSSCAFDWRCVLWSRFCFDHSKGVFIFQPFLPYMVCVLLFYPLCEVVAFILILAGLQEWKWLFSSLHLGKKSISFQEDDKWKKKLYMPPGPLPHSLFGSLGLFFNTEHVPRAGLTHITQLQAVLWVGILQGCLAGKLNFQIPGTVIKLFSKATKEQGTLPQRLWLS